MENPVSTVTSAARSALSFKAILALLFGLLALFALAEATGKTGWIVSPIASFKAWRAKSATA
jgi:hypothetical protein